MLTGVVQRLIVHEHGAPSAVKLHYSYPVPPGLNHKNTKGMETKGQRSAGMNSKREFSILYFSKNYCGKSESHPYEHCLIKGLKYLILNIINDPAINVKYKFKANLVYIQ